MLIRNNILRAALFVDPRQKYPFGDFSEYPLWYTKTWSYEPLSTILINFFKITKE